MDEKEYQNSRAVWKRSGPSETAGLPAEAGLVTQEEYRIKREEISAAR